MPPVDGASGTTSSKAKTAASVTARSLSRWHAFDRVRRSWMSAVVMENPALPPRAWRVPRGVSCVRTSLRRFSLLPVSAPGRLELDNVEFIEADAEQLDFEKESFDAIVSRALLMFLPDVPRTLTRLRSFLKPGGRLAASVWGDKSSVQFATAGSIIADELGLPPPPPGLPGIFALADQRRLERSAREAGFQDVETGTTAVVFETETPAQFTEFIRDVAPPFSVLLKDQTPDARERIWGKVTEAYGRFADATGRVRTTNEAVWVAGTKERLGS